jgi:hypothetical protein
MRTKRSAKGRTFLALLAVSAGLASASAPTGRGMAYLDFGLHLNRMGDFQSYLDRSDMGYPTLAKTYWTLGGGGLFIGRSLVVGLEGVCLLSRERAAGGHQSELGGAFGLLQIGYALINSDRLTLYPLIGAGGGAFTWHVQSDVRPESFEDAILYPEKGSSLLNASFILQAALGADYWVRMKSGDRGTSCVVVGLRLGYTYSPFGDNWELLTADQALELKGGPELGITGPFFRLVVGWGGIGRNRR